MEEVRIRNLAELRGVLAAAPVFSHMSRGERFFIFPIETRRLSGAVDRINARTTSPASAGAAAPATPPCSASATA